MIATAMLVCAGLALAWPAAAASDFPEFPLPARTSEPNGIARGPDGNMWFTEIVGNKIGRITPGGVITEFTLPPNGLGQSAQPLAIVAGPDNAMWFTMSTASRIGRITMTGETTFFPTPTASSGPSGIALGPDNRIWFTEIAANRIGRLAIGTGRIVEFAVPTPNSRPARIATGPDGNLWFTESQTNPPVDKIGRITPDGVITEFPVPTPGGQPWAISGTRLDGGTMLFSERAASRIGQIDMNGSVIREIPTPTAGSEPVRFAFGPDGHWWFTEMTGNNLGRLNTDFSITEFPVPTAGSGPSGLVRGDGGVLWLTEQTAGQVARFEVPVTPLQQFVLGFYDQVLDRIPDASEVDAWVSFILANPTPASAGAFAHTFLDSSEYLSHPVTLGSHVDLLYDVFLGRPADPAGRAGWVGALQAGFDTALPGFVSSPEFQSLLPDVQDRTAVGAVVTRFYQELLRREPSTPELSAWAEYIASTGDVAGTARGFFDSAEYNATPRTLAQHVNVLYRTFLGRTPSASEVTPWVGYFEGFRVQVEDAFVGSDEFLFTWAELVRNP